MHVILLFVEFVALALMYVIVDGLIKASTGFSLLQWVLG